MIAITIINSTSVNPNRLRETFSRRASPLGIGSANSRLVGFHQVIDVVRSVKRRRSAQSRYVRSFGRGILDHVPGRHAG